jgi:hypothetical protein
MAEPAAQGTVLFSRDLSLDSAAPAAPPDQSAPDESAKETNSARATETIPIAPEDDPLKVTAAERSALTFTAYDLDVHLIPPSAGIRARAGLAIRNDGFTPLHRLVLQISSSMTWESFSTAGIAVSTPAAHSSLEFKTRRVATDADHTGWAQEAVVTLPKPLAPGETIAVSALYSGTIVPSAERLERIGAPPAQAEDADWDAIGSGDALASSGPDSPTGGTALRGFGNVLWYPVASPPLFLGEGASLFDAVGRAKLRESSATISLRLAIEFVGDAPDAAFFCGRREALAILRDNPDLPAAESPGVATAAFDTQPLGFRVPSLFVASHPASAVDIPADQNLIAAVTDRYDALPAYAAAATLVEPLLSDWFGARPLSTLNLLDHAGQPFEDDSLLVRPMRVEEASQLAPALAHSLTHVWIHSSRPWIEEGLAQFAGLLWTERTMGRAAALHALQEAARTIAAAEPVPGSTPAADAAGNVHGASFLSGSIASPASSDSSSSSSTPDSRPLDTPPDSSGQSLLDATSDVFYRNKAAAVWWMLRGITGDDALKQALRAYRLDPKLDRDPQGFEHTLEEMSHKDLRWFFESWVDRDRGLPDLSIVNVTPRQIEARNGMPAGWLISVEVRNDGDASAEVPVTVRSAASAGSARSAESQTMRIAGHSMISRRIVFSGTPDEVQVNDGGVPERNASVHIRRLVLPASR